MIMALGLFYYELENKAHKKVIVAKNNSKWKQTRRIINV